MLRSCISSPNHGIVTIMGDRIEKYSEEKSSAKRKESQWPEETCSVVRACFWEEKIAWKPAVIEGGALSGATDGIASGLGLQPQANLRDVQEFWGHKVSRQPRATRTSIPSGCARSGNLLLHW